jgi:hypothetical protein
MKRGEASQVRLVGEIGRMIEGEVCNYTLVNMPSCIANRCALLCSFQVESSLQWYKLLCA